MSFRPHAGRLGCGAPRVRRQIPLRKMGQTGPVEAFLQAGLPLVLLAQREEPARERCCLASQFGECAQVAQQRHGDVVVARVLRLDQHPGLFPCRLLPGGEFVKAPGVRGSLSLDVLLCRG